MTIRDDIPLGFTYNAKGQELTFKDSSGYCWERTYNEAGLPLMFKDRSGYQSEYTYDAAGQVLTYRNSDNYWREFTYDDKGNELTFKDPTGTWKFLAESEYKLYVSEETGIYWAGCQQLSYEAALRYLHWRMDARARKFRKAIKAHHAQREQA